MEGTKSRILVTQEESGSTRQNVYANAYRRQRSMYGTVLAPRTGLDANLERTLAETDGRHLSTQAAVSSTSQATAAVASEFDELASEWSKATAFQSSVHSVVLHPAYQRIISMGEKAIPLILARLRLNADHWFWALTSITGESPIDPKDSGNVQAMARSWIDWGRRRGYVL